MATARDKLLLIVLLANIITFTLATCPAETAALRTVTGSCNHQTDIERGSAEQIFYRSKVGTFYEDGLSIPRESPRTTRVATNVLSDSSSTPKDTTACNTVSLFHTIFGQFVAHDHTFSMKFPFVGGPVNTTTDLVIPVGPDDPFSFNRDGTPKPFDEQNPGVIRTGKSFAITDENGVRQPINSQTGWLDLSTVYWRDETNLNQFRSFTDGRFGLSDHTLISTWNPANQRDLTSDPERRKLFDNLLVLTQTGTPIDRSLHGSDPDSEIFVSGDERAGENTGLAAVHLMWVKEHNYIAANLKAQHPDWTDEQLFVKARHINIGQYQHMVHTEWLTALLGDMQTARYLGKWTGYKPSVNGQISVINAFASLRYGHSTIINFLLMYDNCRNRDLLKGFNGQLGTRGVSNVRQVMGSATSSDVVRTLIYTAIEDLDTLVHPTLRNVLFSFPNTGLDIPSRNMARARLEGVPAWNTVFDTFNGLEPEPGRLYNLPGCSSTESSPGLDDLGCFSSWLDNDTLSAPMQFVYEKLIHVDPWMAFLAERKALGSNLGRTGSRVFLEQFRRGRDGDRFWFENLPNLPVSTLLGETALTQAEVDAIKTVTLGDMIKRHFPEINSQDDPFSAAVEGHPIFDTCAATARISLNDKDGVQIDDALFPGNIIDLMGSLSGAEFVAAIVDPAVAMEFEVSFQGGTTYTFVDESAPFTLPVSALYPSSECGSDHDILAEVFIKATPYKDVFPGGDTGFPLNLPVQLSGDTTSAVTGFALSKDLTGGVCNDQVIPSSASIAIEAITSGSVDSVEFYLDGVLIQTENFAGYFIAGGDNAGNSIPWTLPSVGAHTLTAIPFYDVGGVATAGLPHERRIIIS